MSETPQFHISFQCPACRAVLTLASAEAKGPCPHCHKEIEVHFSARLADSTNDDQHFTRRFEGRRFRPSKNP